MNNIEKLIAVSVSFGQAKELLDHEPTQWNIHEYLRLVNKMNAKKSPSFLCKEKTKGLYRKKQTDYIPHSRSHCNQESTKNKNSTSLIVVQK